MHGGIANKNLNNIKGGYQRGRRRSRINRLANEYREYKGRSSSGREIEREREIEANFHKACIIPLEGTGSC